MRARHIEAFHAIYVNGSISTAARAPSISQPSLSKLLKHAEARLGFVLFRRVKGRLVPTDDAHVLFREAADIQQRLGAMRRTARFAGTIVGAADSRREGVTRGVVSGQ